MILVTGATGFIGRRVIARLHGDGHRVRALVLPGEDVSGILGATSHDATHSADPRNATEIVRGDVRDATTVRAAAHGVSHIIHLAAVVTDWGDDAVFHAINVGGTRNILDAAAGENCQRVLMVSSVVVYGWQLRSRQCHEDSPRQRGVGPYSRTKSESEELALTYHRQGRVPVTIVRPGNVYGPGSPNWVDEIVSLLGAGSLVMIGDGSGDASLAYVDNVVDVIVRATMHPHSAGKIYNANDGSGVSWRQYFHDLARLIDVRPPRRSIPLPVARALAITMERSFKLLRRTRRPLLTTEAVVLISSRHPVPIRRAVDELDYRPISYDDAMKSVAAYLNGVES